MSRKTHWLQARQEGCAANSRCRMRVAVSWMSASQAALRSTVGRRPARSPDSRKRSSTRSGRRPRVRSRANA